MSVAAETKQREVPPDLSLEIGKAMALSRYALQEINDADHPFLKKAFAGSVVTSENFVCTLIALRDTMLEVCRLSGVPK